jgi:hypothetical protein
MMRLLAVPAPQNWLKRFDFLNRGTLEVKPVSLICKCCHKLPPPKFFAKNKLNHGTFPLTVENLTIQSKKQHLNLKYIKGACYSLDWSCFTAIVYNERFYRGPPMHAQLLQVDAKTAWQNQVIYSVRRQVGLELCVLISNMHNWLQRFT